MREIKFRAWLKAEKGYHTELDMTTENQWCENCRMADPFHISDEDWDRLVAEFLSEVNK